MKKVVWLIVSFAFISYNLIAQKVKFDEIKEQCSGLKLNQRVRVSVSSFNVSTVSNPGQLGDEMAQMLTDALQNVNCFNVLLSVKDSKQLTDEIAFGQAGNTMAGSSPATGKMKGPQVIVIGKVTSFSSGEKSAGALGINVTGGNRVKIGFIIQLINAETREMIASKSIDVDGKSGGLSGVKIFGINAGGGSSSKAVQEVCQKGIIEAVEFIASKKDDLGLPEGSSGVADVKVFNASNCTVLKSAYIPKIMVILPEFHISRRIPDPAGETEINRKFIEAGFRVVDPAMFATIQNSARFNEAARNPAQAISLGKQFGADIVIYGEAFSQLVGSQNNQISCRARTEVRAVRTDDATIIATNGLEAGAVDNAEFVAAKSALRSAASLTADYLLGQFCSKNIVFSSVSSGSSVSSVADKPFTEIIILNADYSKVKALADLIAVKGKIITRNITEGKGYIKIEHAGSTDTIADFIDSKSASKYSIQNSETGKITVMAK